MLRRILPSVRLALQVPKATTTPVRSTSGSVYEPDYLESLKPKFPQYESLNVQIKGYDYPQLESYQRFLHGVAEYLELDLAKIADREPRLNPCLEGFLPANSSVCGAHAPASCHLRGLLAIGALEHIDLGCTPKTCRRQGDTRCVISAADLWSGISSIAIVIISCLRSFTRIC
ncbi:GD23111 [Drosophila simulans]|uniref:GD23111 n=1 Tax=Drosophila simulans TaxID=7240 RepID=B4Q774_DROSI|nr:GD23111 [Drosophila simulans]